MKKRKKSPKKRETNAQRLKEMAGDENAE